MSLPRIIRARVPLLFTLGASNVELLADVRFTFHPGDKRQTVRPTDIDPPEGPSVEDVEVLSLRFADGGAYVRVPRSESAEIAEGIDHAQLIEAAQAADTDARERAAVWRREQARDDATYALLYGYHHADAE